MMHSGCAHSKAPEPWKVGAVKALVQAGVDLDARNENGDTAMDIAIYKNEPAVIDALKQVRQGQSSSIYLSV